MIPTQEHLKVFRLKLGLICFKISPLKLLMYSSRFSSHKLRTLSQELLFLSWGQFLELFFLGFIELREVWLEDAH